jgi:hypothetical protein
MLARMFAKRMRGYRAMGYITEDDKHSIRAITHDDPQDVPPQSWTDEMLFL